MTRLTAFIDLQAQRRRIGPRMDEAMARVLDHGKFIMGPEVAELEDRLAAFCGAKHAITCANGTDALQLALMSKGIGPGDAVFVPSFTFASTSEAVANVGATPVFVDILPETFNMDPASLRAALGRRHGGDLNPAAVIPVDLYGQPADYPAIQAVAEEFSLTVIADAAQSFGATLKNRKVGTLADITTTSFFPAKPLGCYGDGGAIFTDDDGIAAVLRSLRLHGRGAHKYDHERVGVNSRLDTLQAAVLIEKLAIFSEEAEARQPIAERYQAALRDVAGVSKLISGVVSAWAYYTLVLEDRDSVALSLKEAGVPTAIYYPKPLHRQTAYSGFPRAPEGLPVAEEMARKVLSLPMHPYLDAGVQGQIIAVLRQALEADLLTGTKG